MRTLLGAIVLIFVIGGGSNTSFAKCCGGYIMCRAAPVGDPGHGFTTFCANCNFAPSGILGGRCCSSVSKDWACNVFCCNCDYPCISETSANVHPNCGPLQNACTPTTKGMSLSKGGQLKFEKQLFDTIDSDQNGQISFDETLFYLTHGVQQPTREQVAAVREGFERTDTDKNGSISVREFDRDLADHLKK